MNKNNKNFLDYNSAAKLNNKFIFSLITISIMLAALHFFFNDLKVGGVYWFNLDKERNIPTWFNGILFFLFGVSALFAYKAEKSKLTADSKFSFLWIGVLICGLFMSLDDMTILHENLFWKEVRQETGKISSVWQYVTQWQIIFAPFIIFALFYFVIFFSNRFLKSRKATIFAFSGLGLWIAAILLEALRQLFINLGETYYSLAVVVEESFEMIGAVFLIGAINQYSINIFFKPETTGIAAAIFGKFFNARTVKFSLTSLFILSFIFISVYLTASYLESENAPVPKLYKTATESDDINYKQILNQLNNSLDMTTRDVWFDDVNSYTKLDRESLQAITIWINNELRNKINTSLTGFIQEYNKPVIIFVTIKIENKYFPSVAGTGRNLTDAINNAVSILKNSFIPFDRIEETKFEIVTETDTLIITTGTPLNIITNLHGIALDETAGLALTTNDINHFDLVNEYNNLKMENLNEFLTDRKHQSEKLTIYLKDGKSKFYKFKTDFYIHNN